MSDGDLGMPCQDCADTSKTHNKYNNKKKSERTNSLLNYHKAKPKNRSKAHPKNKNKQNTAQNAKNETQQRKILKHKKTKASFTDQPPNEPRHNTAKKEPTVKHKKRQTTRARPY
jgi:hypothetical protein